MIDVCCALIFKAGRLLAVQRKADTDHPYQWEFPGGKIEPAETAVACIKREIFEELGVGLQAEAILRPVEHDYGTKQVRLYPFIGRLAEDETPKLSEHENVVYLNAGDLFELDWQAADRTIVVQNQREILNRLGQHHED